MKLLLFNSSFQEGDQVTVNKPGSPYHNMSGYIRIRQTSVNTTPDGLKIWKYTVEFPEAPTDWPDHYAFYASELVSRVTRAR